MDNEFDLRSLADIGANVARHHKELHPDELNTTNYVPSYLPHEFVDGFLTEVARP